MSDSRSTEDSPLLRAIRELGRRPAAGAASALRFRAGLARDPNGGASDIASMADAAEQSRRAATAARDAPADLPPPVNTVEEIVRAVAEGAPMAEQLERAIGRADLLDDEINAFVWRDGPGARETARRLETDRALPLAGVPIGHKDILWTASGPTTAGSDLLARFRAPRDAAVVQRLAAAGAISLGKLNTHEFATGITGRVSAHGPTLNPRSRDRLPGGSSCGSAAAVAAGMVAAATATDTGGSIRIPAACCGVVGFKPTFDAVPVDGVIPFAWSLDHVGVIAGDVAGAARVHSVMAADAELLSDLSVAEIRSDRTFRFALAETWQARCDDATASALERLAEALATAGAERASVDVPSPDGMAAIAGAIFLTEGGAVHADTLKRFPERYQNATRRFLSQAQGVTAIEYVQAQRSRAMVCEAFERIHERVDVLICPALPTPAPPVDASEIVLPDGRLEVRAAMTLFTRPFNLSGQPVVCLPVASDPAGIPIAVQLVGATRSDRQLLTRARWIEQRAPR
jgi:aspartyl-tRNA(Asn)/glutamyl-tRNA(Gln) amidotransferase subunit A